MGNRLQVHGSIGVEMAVDVFRLAIDAVPVVLSVQHDVRGNDMNTKLCSEGWWYVSDGLGHDADGWFDLFHLRLRGL